MRAIVIDPLGKPRLDDLPEPAGPGVPVRVRACGLCGSDVEKLGRTRAGAVLGHEVVAETAAGERVALVHHLPCGDCARCRAGHETTCAAFAAATIVPGGFAERALATRTLPLPDDVDDMRGTFVEPLACVLRALARAPRGRMLVVGGGFVGALFVQALRARGDEPVVRDVRPDRLELARRLGAARDDGAPFAAAVLCARGGLNEALDSLEPGGTLLVFAAPHDPVPVDLAAVYRRELRLEGARSATPRHMEQALALLPALEPLPAVELPLDRFVEGLDLYRRGEALKVVFRP